jgi:hypothetical protein
MFENTFSVASEIDPTFVAPTGDREKYPCSHSPINTTRSFIPRRFSNFLATRGATGNKYPGTYRRF